MAFEMVAKMLNYRPLSRISATAALHCPYFTSEEPTACEPHELPMPDGDWHEFESKQRKKRQQADGAIRRTIDGATADRKKRQKPTHSIKGGGDDSPLAAPASAK